MYVSRARMRSLLGACLALSCILMVSLSATADEYAFDLVSHKVVSSHVMPDLNVNSNELKVAKEVIGYGRSEVTYLTLLSESSAKLSAHNSALCQAKNEVGWQRLSSLETAA